MPEQTAALPQNFYRIPCNGALSFCQSPEDCPQYILLQTILPYYTFLPLKNGLFGSRLHAVHHYPMQKYWKLCLSSMQTVCFPFQNKNIKKLFLTAGGPLLTLYKSFFSTGLPFLSSLTAYRHKNIGNDKGGQYCEKHDLLFESGIPTHMCSGKKPHLCAGHAQQYGGSSFGNVRCQPLFL